MSKGGTSRKGYEEYAYVLDVNPRGRSKTVRGRDGILVTAVGEGRLTLLEMLAEKNTSFAVGERIHIGREERTKISSVLGKLDYGRISDDAKAELPAVVETIVTNSEERFMKYVNNAQPLTYKVHALDVIPGVARIGLKVVLEERDRKEFTSYEDLHERTGLEPVRQIAQRIMDEITGEAKVNIFVKR